MSANGIYPLNRIIIIGTSGSGKTTFAKALASTLGIPHVELDAIHWAANWTQVPDDEMRLRVSEATASPRWIMDGNYGQVRDIVWGQADTLIWLKYSFPTIFFRAFKRTIKRVLTQEELWHRNREHWKMAFFSRESVLGG